MRNISSLEQKILNLADHCVKCGLCSSHCPTYRLQQDENESPRGRIALAQGLASGAIRTSVKASFHLNNCLQCMRCEKVCPSQVSYNKLITATAELLQQRNQASNILQTKITRFISSLSHKHWQKLAGIFDFFSRTGLLQILRFNHSGKRLLKYLPNPEKAQNTALKTPVSAHLREPVFIFTGCISHIFAKRTLQTSIELLNFCGYSVNSPKNQVCCGAVAARQGLAKIAQQCQLENQLAFSDNNNAAIIFFTTGCGTKLKEYKQWLPAETNFADRVFDITPFLNESKLFAKLKFSALKKRVLIFNPCSERNVLKQSSATTKLLSRIPDIELVYLSDSTGCCGASGSHLFTHPQQADRIRQPVIEQIISLSPDVITGPNYPCNMHLHAGLKEKGLDIQVMHPIELLHKQITLEST